VRQASECLTFSNLWQWGQGFSCQEQRKRQKFWQGSRTDFLVWRFKVPQGKRRDLTARCMWTPTCISSSFAKSLVMQQWTNCSSRARHLLVCLGAVHWLMIPIYLRHRLDDCLCAYQLLPSPRIVHSTKKDFLKYALLSLHQHAS
jgi:hypothetical protein